LPFNKFVDKQINGKLNARKEAVMYSDVLRGKLANESTQFNPLCMESINHLTNHKAINNSIESDSMNQLVCLLKSKIEDLNNIISFVLKLLEDKEKKLTVAQEAYANLRRSYNSLIAQHNVKGRVI
jgi:hypothetical protein